jgi:hypothetical protein
MKRIRETVLMLAATLLSAIPVWPVEAQEGVPLSFEMTRQVTLGEPVVFTYTVANETNQEVWVSAGADRIRAFLFESVAPSGLRQVGRYRHHSGGLRIDPFAIQTGSSYSQNAAIGEWLQFNEVGRYTVTVTFEGSLIRGTQAMQARMTAATKQARGAEVSIIPDFLPSELPAARRHSRILTVDVLPRDEARLQALSMELFARAGRTGSADAREAIDQLGTIRDPIVIPYLEALLASERTSKYFRVLAEMGQPEARAALDRLSKSGKAAVANDAKKFRQAAK